jgi:hypothetical protein
MATHDYVIANGTGNAVRSDLNNALAAIVSNNSGSSEPSTKYAYQWWADTTTGQLKLRNSANNAWITIFELDGTMLMEDGTVSAPGLAFASDLNTGFFRSAADKINFATGGNERLEIGSSEAVFNDGSNDVDFRVESNGNTHMLFVDGGNDRVQIGSSASREVGYGDNASLQLEGTSYPKAAITSILNSNNANGPSLNLAKSRGTSNGSSTVVQNDDILGLIAFAGTDGNDIRTMGAKIQVNVDGTPGNNDMPGRLVFATTADGASSPTERMRIGSGGALQIGNTASSAHGSRFLQVGDTSSSAAYIEVRASTSGDGGLLFSDGTAGDDSGFRGTVEYNHASDFMQFKTAATARMRLDDNGLISNFASGNSTNLRLRNSAGAGAVVFLQGLHNANSPTSGGTTSFIVYTNGNVENTNNSYGQISDQKLKENIVDANSQWDNIKGVRVRNFNFIEGQTHTQIGVVAQELEVVSPGLIDESPDRDAEGKDLGTVTKSVKYSVLYMKAVKALQEAMTRIETLETKVAALEAG